jgi:hypothetical protein
MKRASVVAFVVLIICLALVESQQRPAPPTPAPELKKLDYFVGEWKAVGELKPSPMGPGGKFFSVDHNEWMSGRFFLVSHSIGGIAMEHFSETAFMGWDTQDKAYSYDSFNSRGEVEHAKGSLEGNTWTWNNTENVQGKVTKGRYTVTVVSPSSYTFKLELAPEGGDYSTILEGKATKTPESKAGKAAEGTGTKK